MSSQRCIDWEAYKKKNVESEPYHPPIIKDNSYELVGEDRYYGGNVLHKDLIPSTTWFNNVRSCISSNSWDKLRHKIYERVDYKCECCGVDCKKIGCMIHPNLSLKLLIHQIQILMVKQN